jgi:ATP-dependent Clp protease ATP-binding subunit ClpX
MNQEIKLLRPDEIKEQLDKVVIGQDEAKKTLAVAVYNHYKRITTPPMIDAPKLEKSNVFLLGPTGCGKTFLVENIAKMIGVPYYIADCTKLTAAGYVGADVEDCIAGLLRSCDYNVEMAQKGIVILDEVDKIAAGRGVSSSTFRDVGGEEVQQSLLKIVEGDNVGVQPMGGRKHPEQPLTYVDTTNILFIVTGAFVGLTDIIAKRLGSSKGKIGFGFPIDRGKKIEGNLLRFTTPEDIRKFGMIPEFVGRFPIITYVNPLEKEDLVKILTEPENAILKQYALYLYLDGVYTVIYHNAVERIAELTLKTGSGARGLRGILECIFRDWMYEAPSMQGENKQVELTLDVVNEKTQRFAM